MMDKFIDLVLKLFGHSLFVNSEIFYALILTFVRFCATITSHDQSSMSVASLKTTESVHRGISADATVKLGGPPESATAPERGLVMKKRIITLMVLATAFGAVAVSCSAETSSYLAPTAWYEDGWGAGIGAGTVRGYGPADHRPGQVATRAEAQAFARAEAQRERRETLPWTIASLLLAGVVGGLVVALLMRRQPAPAPQVVVVPPVVVQQQQQQGGQSRRCGSLPRCRLARGCIGCPWGP